MASSTSTPLATAKFTPSSEDVRQFQIWHLIRTRTGKISVQTMLAILLLMPLAMGGVVFLYDWKFAIGLVCLGYLGVLIKGRGSPRLLALAMVQGSLPINNHEVGFAEASCQLITVQLHEEGISRESFYGYELRPWGRLSTIYQAGEFMVFLSQELPLFTVPARAFEQKEDLERFVSICNTMIRNQREE